MDDPQTDDEWRACCAISKALLAIDSAKQYGLIEGGPTIHVDRCLEILERGKERGIEPTDADVEWAIVELSRPHAERPPES